MKDVKIQIKRIKSMFPDAEIFEVDADYEDFHAIIDGIRMIFYPHKVRSTHNYHTRVRNGSTKRGEEFLALATILNINANYPVKNEYRRVWWHGENKENIMKQFPKYQKYWGRAEAIKLRSAA